MCVLMGAWHEAELAQAEFPVAPNLPPARKSVPGEGAWNSVELEGTGARGNAALETKKAPGDCLGLSSVAGARLDGQAKPQPNGPWSGPKGEERSDE